MIPLENIEGYIWFDGKFIKIDEANVHILTHSIHYGGSVFEGEKSFNGKIFKIEQHTDRLINSAKLLDLEIPFSKEEIIAATYELLKLNNLSDAYIRPLVWRSTSSLALNPQMPKTHIMVAAWVPRKKDDYKRLDLEISRWIKPSAKMLPTQAKSSSSYTIPILAVTEASNKGFDDAIMLDDQDYISECTTSNIFFIKNSELITPKTTSCLSGITRQTVFEIAENFNIKTTEMDITIDDLASCESGFITGTAAGLKEIRLINNKGNNFTFEPSNIFQRLKNKYDNLVRGIND